jgi:hypothetical protein
MTRFFNLIAVFFLVCGVFVFHGDLKAEEELFSLSFGPVQLGESRIPISLKDFSVSMKKMEKGQNIKSGLLKNSVQWVRNKHNLLIPRARLGIRIKSAKGDYFIKYKGRPVILEQKNDHSYGEVYISLFNPSMVHIFKEKNEVAQINIRSNGKNSQSRTQLVDYSCSPYGVSISGLDNEYLSAGCRLDRTGMWGKEKARLEITWSTTNYRLLDGTEPPYTTVLTGRGVSNVYMSKSSKERPVQVSISANVPKRIHRLKTAFGIGPYSFKSFEGAVYRESEISPAFMLYGKLDLNRSASLRFFDALIWRNSIFNNVGAYFAYELAEILDKRVKIVPLLGFQGLSFKYSSSSDMNTEFIYPQGVELVYKHAFGLENYHLIYGMFIPVTKNDDDYNNLWLRFGKKVFWEINYIDWKKNDQFASMWGLSIGIPFGQFF